jgi:Protein of unknown function (DUF2793)
MRFDMSELTARLKLPLLATGQAQKEVTHNEALLLADMLVQPVVLAVAQNAVPASPSPGQCWIVGGSATGDWTGKANQIACWTAGGWRFAVPFDALVVWSLADAMHMQWNGSGWIAGASNAKHYAIDGTAVIGAQKAAIAAPSGGVTVDYEARITLGAILNALRGHGLIAT